MESEGQWEVSEKPKSAPTAEKYGWIKKSSGGLLGLWKDRYIQLRKTQLVVYEDEDEQKYIETVELESYDKCQELRALLKRKNRFHFNPLPGVHDIKFQAPTLEEKESWIKALNEGINRGKNKVFDEVKVDESLSLDHVTRDRVKVSHGRRPPTRSHLKEVSCTSDGILRLDLDIVDNGPPTFDSTISESDNEPPQKETPKPPMPPTKPTDKKLKEGITSKDGINAKEEDSSVPDKLKVAWDQPTIEPKKTEDLESDDGKDNLAEIAAADVTKPPVPPKVLSEKMLATVNSSHGDLEAGGWEEQESGKTSLATETDHESLKLRCSSLGDLLSDSKNKQRALPAEKLLQKVLREGLEQAQGGNGPPVMAETLLNEAVEQLRQATQVLQEIKGLGELKREGIQKQKEKQKDLVTLYRRSAP
uniref:Pleckstrin homology domain containing O2 n=1 Tax=Corvus moneduloides TaxID=1196302 RepID=A0A8U7MMF3_CORMO